MLATHVPKENDYATKRFHLEKALAVMPALHANVRQSVGQDLNVSELQQDLDETLAELNKIDPQ